MFDLTKENQMIEGTLNLANRKDIKKLPKGLKVGYLDLQGCAGLKKLPKGLKVSCLILV